MPVSTYNGKSISNVRYEGYWEVSSDLKEMAHRGKFTIVGDFYVCRE